MMDAKRTCPVHCRPGCTGTNALQNVTNFTQYSVGRVSPDRGPVGGWRSWPRRGASPATVPDGRREAHGDAPETVGFVDHLDSDAGRGNRSTAAALLRPT